MLTVAPRTLLVAPAPDGRLVLEAVPWATVAAIEANDGTQMPLPAQATTPFVIDVPTGSYRVRFVGPPPQLVEQVVVVEASAGSPRIVTAPAFSVPTPEAYFEPYLAVGAPESEPTPLGTSSQGVPEVGR